MKMFITAHFKGAENRAEIEELCRIVSDAGFEAFCFIRDVENYQKTFSDAHELMRRAKEEILKCDALFIDLSTTSTGRAIETWIAFGAGKKIVVVIQKWTQLRDTAKWIADTIIEYDTLEDIVVPLRNFLQSQESNS